MTSSTGCSGLMRDGSPPNLTIASRIAARSTTRQHPVEVLEKNAARRERNLARGLRLGIPLREPRDVVGANDATVFGPEQVFEQDAERKG